MAPLRNGVSPQIENRQVGIICFYHRKLSLKFQKDQSWIGRNLRERFKKKMVEFSTEGGGSTHSTKFIYFDQKKRVLQTTPNGLKHENNQKKNLPIVTPPYHHKPLLLSTPHFFLWNKWWMRTPYIQWKKLKEEERVRIWFKNFCGLNVISSFSWLIIHWFVKDIFLSLLVPKRKSLYVSI